MSGARIHDRVSVHSICFPAAGVDELFHLWTKLRTKRVSFSSGQLSDHDPEAVRARLTAAGFVAETLTHVFRPGTLSSRRDDIRHDREALSRAIAMAAAIGAGSIYMLTGGRGALSWEAAADIFAEAIEPCRAEARDAGVVLSIENATAFYADLHLGNNLRDTILLAERAGIGVNIDIFAGWTEAGLHELVARALPICCLIQVSDYVYGDRGLPCRAVPGDGAIPLKPIIAQALDAGYAGAFDLELIGPRIDAEGQLEAVGRAAGNVGQMLRELGV